MRKLLFILFLATSGFFAQAQDMQSSSRPFLYKVYEPTIPIKRVTDDMVLSKIKASSVSGIFVMKHFRVKRALNFTIKAKNPKLV